MNTMTANRPTTDLLRAATLSVALIASGASTTLADPPGYYFQDSGPSKHPQLQSARPATASAAQNSSDASGLKKPPAASKVDDSNYSCNSGNRSADQ